MIDNNKTNSKSSSRVGRYISSLLSLRSLLTRGAAFALLAGIGTSCSQSMDEEAMTRIGAPMTVTATMQGVGKPAAAVSEVVSGSGTGFPATRTTTVDVATGGSYTAAWQKGDVVNVTFHCYSDAGGTTEIAASQMANGNTQTLTYNGTAWTATPASLRLPACAYSVKAVYTYSRTYTAADDTPIDGTTILTLINRGTEQIAGQSAVVVPDDITKTGIAIAPAADKWQRQTALVRLTSLAFGQSATVTTGAGTATTVSCPTVQTADASQPANAVLTSTVYLHQPVDNPANTSAVTTVTLDGVSGVVKPAFHTEAGRLYSIYAPVLLGQQGIGDEDGGQYMTWKGTYAQFYNNGFGANNILKYKNWIIDLSAVSDKTTAISFIKGETLNHISTVSLTLTGIETILEKDFFDCNKIAGISLPSVTSIGISAFTNCDALTNVNLPAVTSIAKWAFMSCPTLTSVIMPVVTAIGQEAFYNCKVLANVSMPAVKTIELGAFANTVLTSLNTPVATTIGDYAFNECNSLANVSMPEVTSIGTYSFSSCYLLTGVNMPKVKNIGENAFMACEAITYIDMPVATNVNAHAFSGCKKLTDVSLPAATTIGDYAFNRCLSLTDISLPAVTTISNCTFFQCDLLASVSLPMANNIGNYAFAYCPVLTTLKLTAAGVMTLDAGLFNGFSKSANCTLYLNTDKQSGIGTPKPSGLSWFGQTWKAIKFEQ